MSGGIKRTGYRKVRKKVRKKIWLNTANQRDNLNLEEIKNLIFEQKMRFCRAGEGILPKASLWENPRPADYK